MTILISVGLPGSGKTACAVRDLMMNKTGRKVYSNIITKHIPNNHLIKAEYIFKKTLVDVKEKRDGSKVPIYDYELNEEFWTSIKEPVSVIVDEAHTIINARRSMSKKNVIMGDWLSLIRRVLSGVEGGYGELHLITQIPRRIDVLAKEMATQVRLHICHYLKSCKRCSYTWQETNDEREPMWRCSNCGSYDLRKHSHRIEVFHFANMQMYEAYEFFGMKSFHRHYFVNDIEKVFPLYDTLQWDNLFSKMGI